jgi:hypothetical protein
MAQPSSKIAEAFCGRGSAREGDAKLRGDSVSSKSSLDQLTCADTEASAQKQQRGTEELAGVAGHRCLTRGCYALRNVVLNCREWRRALEASILPPHCAADKSGVPSRSSVGFAPNDW